MDIRLIGDDFRLDMISIVKEPNTKDVKKKCTKCGSNKYLTEFFKNTTRSLGVDSHCKKCRTISNKKYYRTIDGIISRMYGSMRHRIKKGQVPNGILTREEFETICKQKANELRNLIKNWSYNNYPLNGTPSVDRIDSAKGYIKGNIQFLTLRENSIKGQDDKKKLQVKRGGYLYPTDTHRWCFGCLDLVKKELFSKAKHSPDGLYSRCKLCNKRYRESLKIAK